MLKYRNERKINMTRKPNIAILGATGVVGREIIQILDELKVEYNSIKFL